MFKKLLAATVALVTSVASFAQTAAPVDYTTYITPIKDAQASYGPIMAGIAVAAVGIMIGIKWIKRARGVA